jgi:hypothetical protein
MKLLGIEFAPLCVPMHRRYEILALSSWFVVITFGGTIGLFIWFFLLFTRLWWLVPLYIVWMYLDRHTCENGGRIIKWVQDWRWWYHMMKYFPVEMDCVPDFSLASDRNYLFCCFPHGVIPVGPFNAIASSFGGLRRAYPEFTVKSAVLNLFFLQPISRELGLSMGMISCSIKSLNYELSRPEGGHIVTLMPGGTTEAYNSQPGKYKFVVKKRKGFVKVALRNGAPLVPVISFGETDLFDQLESRALRKIQEFIRKYLGFAPVIINGRGFFQYSFGIIPRRKPVTTVGKIFVSRYSSCTTLIECFLSVGAPIEVTKIANPTNEQIEELHGKFVQALISLFDEYKYKYLENPEDKHLELQ